MCRAIWFACIGLMLGASSLPSASPHPRYLRHNTDAKGVIVFVHGLTGDGTSTWTNPETHTYWPDLISHDTLFDAFDIYVYEYPSPRFSRTYSPDEVAENMRLHFDNDKVTRHDHIVFLAHSLGGIVTRAYLTSYRNAAQRVSFVYFYSVPTTGSEVATLGTLLSKNPQFGKLQIMASEDYLADLQRHWLDAQFTFPSYCAYERLKTFGALVVTQASASNLCTRHLDPIDTDHIDIVKPADTSSPSYIAFRTAFDQEVVAPETRNPTPGVRSATPRSTSVPSAKAIAPIPTTSKAPAPPAPASPVPTSLPDKPPEQNCLNGNCIGGDNNGVIIGPNNFGAGTIAPTAKDIAIEVAKLIEDAKKRPESPADRWTVEELKMRAGLVVFNMRQLQLKFSTESRNLSNQQMEEIGAIFEQQKAQYGKPRPDLEPALSTWKRHGDELSQLTFRHRGEWDNFRPTAFSIWTQLLKRCNIDPNKLDRRLRETSMVIEDSQLAGPSPLADAAAFLEDLAAQLE